MIAGSKNGVVYSLNPDSGALNWSRRVGPGGALGGIHWGIGWLGGRHENGLPHAPHRQRHHFLWGIVPALLAWPGLLMPAFAGLAWLGFMLIICYLADRTLYRRASLEAWLTLRFRLSSIAALSCFIGAGAL